MTDRQIDLAHFDVFDQRDAVHSHATHAYARERCPVAFTESDGGYYLVTGYEDVSRILQDHQTFSSAYGVNPRRRGGMHLPPIDEDPPLHRDYRMLLNRYFAPGALERSYPEMRRIAREAIDDFVDEGTVEFVHGFAGPLAAGILTHVILNQTDSTQERYARDLVVRTIATGTPEAYRELADFCRRLLADRAASDDGGTDTVLDALLSGRIGGRPLSADDQVGVMVTVCLGSLETSPTAMANVIIRLASDPGLEPRLRDPAWVTSDLDEFLRLDSPAAYQARTVTRDVTIGSVDLAAGDMVVAAYGSANRDPRVFDRPDELDFHRGRIPHVAFGAGVHRCIGANFARVQLRAGFGEFFERITNVRLKEGSEIHYHYGMSRSPTVVHITFDRT